MFDCQYHMHINQIFTHCSDIHFCFSYVSARSEPPQHSRSADFTRHHTHTGTHALAGHLVPLRQRVPALTPDVRRSVDVEREFGRAARFPANVRAFHEILPARRSESVSVRLVFRGKFRDRDVVARYVDVFRWVVSLFPNIAQRARCHLYLWEYH